MSDHDPLCEQYYDGGGYYCICDEIAQSRAEERARIVAVLDAMWRDDATVYSHALRGVITDLRAAIEASDE